MDDFDAHPSGRKDHKGSAGMSATISSKGGPPGGGTYPPPAPSPLSFAPNKGSKSKNEKKNGILQELQSHYEEFFIHNCKLISLLEKASWFSTFFFLDGIGQNEFKQTVVNAVLDNWTSLNDYIFQKLSYDLKRNPRDDIDESTMKQLQQVPYIPENALSHAATQTFLSNTELLTEIIATDFLEKKFNFPFKWTSISLIESWRALLRLKLLWQSGGCILTHNSIPSSRSESQAGEENEATLEQLTAPKSATSKPTLLNAIRYNREMEQLNREKNIKRPSPPDFSMVIGELLWILRPLIYLFLLYKHGKTSWDPWLTTLSIELTSHCCHYDRTLNRLERKELATRKLLLLLFLLKSPFYEAALGYLGSVKIVGKVQSKLRSVPSVSGLLDMGNKLLNIYRHRYFNLAGSKY